MTDKDDALENLIETEKVVQNADVVVAENMGSSGDSRVVAYNSYNQNGNEYWKYVYEWNGEGYEMVVDESHTAIHNVRVFGNGGRMYDDRGVSDE